MICPNCKTELVEVNGRYICSGCGREVPENEVMATNWDDGNTRAGLYGAGGADDEAPEEGSKPITDYDSSLTETENELVPRVTTSTPVTSETPEVIDEPTVEEVLQSQQPIIEPETLPDTGFYTAEPATPLSSPTSQIEISSVDRGSTPEVQDSLLQGNDNDNAGILKQVQDDVLPVSEVVEPLAIPPIQEIPVTIPEEPVISTPTASSPTSQIEINNDNGNTESPEQAQNDIEAVPDHAEVVKDMFENTQTASAPSQDPGIYTDPSYEIFQPDISQQAVNNRVTMPADKRTNFVIIVVGSVLALILIVAGLLAYMYLEGVV